MCVSNVLCLCVSAKGRQLPAVRTLLDQRRERVPAVTRHVETLSVFVSHALRTFGGSSVKFHLHDGMETTLTLRSFNRPVRKTASAEAHTSKLARHDGQNQGKRQEKEYTEAWKWSAEEGTS